MSKLKPNAQRIYDMFTQKDATQFAKMFDELLDDLVSDIDNRAVSEFHFTEAGTLKMLGSACYVTPPQKGEFIEINDEYYEVVSVLHRFAKNRKAGNIQVKKADI